MAAGGLGKPPPARIFVDDTALPTGSRPGGIGILLLEAAAAPAAGFGLFVEVLAAGAYS